MPKAHISPAEALIDEVAAMDPASNVNSGFMESEAEAVESAHARGELGALERAASEEQKVPDTTPPAM